MKYLLIKNKKIYKLIYKYELTRIKYKSIIYNRNVPFFIRQKATILLNDLNNKSSLMKLRQRCFITNKGRSVFNFFKISRIKLRLLMSNNYINSIKKSSW